MKKSDSYLNTILEYAKLPPSQISFETFQGIIILAILDTKLFPRNSDLPVFIEKVFELNLKDYVYASRTLIIARVIRKLEKLKKDEIHNLKVNFFEYFQALANINNESDLLKWLKGLDGGKRNESL